MYATSLGGEGRWGRWRNIASRRIIDGRNDVDDDEYDDEYGKDSSMSRDMVDIDNPYPTLMEYPAL